MTAHAVEVAECSWLPGVASLWRTNKDVKKPRYQCASNGENQNGVENALEPFNDGAGSEKKKNDRCFDER
jgi:hypothetical protein